MSWRAITEADLLERMSSDELESVRAIGLASGQADPVAGHIARVTGLVTGFIAANPANRIGTEGTLPERLILPTVDYMVVNVFSRVAGMLIDLNDTRKTAASIALSLFRDVAANRFTVEQPDDGSSEMGAAVELASPASSPMTRDDLGGL